MIAMRLPTGREIELLHKKYAPTNEVLDVVFTHCQIVRDIADQLMQINNFEVDAELVRVGCLLHDIGVHPLFDSYGNERKDIEYITHGIRGEEILRAEGLPEEVCRFASHHTGVGLSRQDIVSQNLALPAENFEAETTEEQIVMYADKFHSKTQPPYFNTHTWYEKHIAKFGTDKVEKFVNMVQQFDVPDLTPLVEKYGHQIRTEDDFKIYST